MVNSRIAPPKRTARFANRWAKFTDGREGALEGQRRCTRC